MLRRWARQFRRALRFFPLLPIFVDTQPDTPSTRTLARRLAALAVPVVLTQVGMMGFGVVDIVMLGRVGVEALDASALGGLWLFGTAIFGIGVMFGLDPIIAHAHGRGDGGRSGLALQRGLVVATLISVPLMGVGWLTEEVLLLMRQDPTLAADAETYVLIQIWSVGPLLWFYGLRQYLQSRELVAPALWVTLIANVINVLGNELLIFDHGHGFGGMGLRGAGLASGVTRTFLIVGLGLWVWRKQLHRGAWQPWSRAAFEPRGLLEILRYGAPTGVHYTIEVWAFQCSTLLAGGLGRDELAAHSIVLNMASVTFMVPLGISFAASTMVGNLLGAGRRASAQRVAWLAVAMGAGVMVASALVLVSTRNFLPRVYTSDVTVLAMAATILPIAASFQVFDGIQVVASGVLRGMGDTISAALFNAVAYFVIALPLSAWLVYSGFGLRAIWAALVLGLALVAVPLLAWIYWRGPATRGSPEDRRTPTQDG